MPAVASLAVLGLALGLLLGLAARYLRVEGNGLASEIEALLPGTQCGQCGYAGCAGAAQALAAGEAPVTVCPGGGRELVSALASRLGIEVDRTAGAGEPQFAEVREQLCIGCTRCFKACPTDAVMGAARQIHVVLREACTGCGQCVATCPTQATRLVPIPATLQSWYWPAPAPG
jgi:electron transport complex protein RnfB